MKKELRIVVKLAVVVILTVLFIRLIYTDEKVLQLEQPEGELIDLSDVWILLKEFREAGAGQISEDILEEIQTLSMTEKYLNYDTYMNILDCTLGETRQAYDKEKITYKNKYKDDFFLLKEDWYNSYEVFLACLGMTDLIHEETVEILCGSEQFAGEEQIDRGCLLGKDGTVYQYISEAFKDLKYTWVKAYVRENRLLTLIEILPDKGVLENVWIMEEEGDSIQFFYEGHELLAEYKKENNDSKILREQVGTVSYQEGIISQVEIKNERISGKLLGMSEGSLEIEGYGNLEIQKENVGYKLYETLSRADWSELAIGYDFADFVLEDGKVCAFLITRKESMETIRVALKSSNFTSLYHDKIVLVGEEPMTIYYGDYEQRMQERVEAGQEITIEAGDKYLSGDRMEVVSDVNTGKIQVLSISRSQGTPAYRGKMEIVETKDGLILINEVLLEEYLYSVVPSEMPASYPLEALKAQAVCARTYGYQYLKQPGYAAIGAHVDDSVGYQVYNNIAENVNTTKAVKETTGELLLYENEPVSAYYYSTSCGFGADAGVWNEDQKEKMPYLTSNHIAHTQGNITPSELSREENFRAYITMVDESAYEKEEPWFRWEYQVDELDVSILLRRLKERFNAAPGKILTFTGKEDEFENPEAYVESEPKEFKEICDIRCLKRKEGGIMDELIIRTDKGTYKVISEYNIRYVLNQGKEVIRQDESSYESSTLLPSAYLIIDTTKNEKNVVGYTIIGGGYGHGVGMSQNGARAMGMEDKDCEGILAFYFHDCQVEKIY